jgi:hypothetical protein
MAHVINEYDKNTEFIINSIMTVPDQFLPAIMDVIGGFNGDDVDVIYCYEVKPYQIAEIALIISADFRVNEKENHFFLEPN